MNTSIVISLIGRPNVGKSSIFNRLMQSQFKAITHDKPGVTRDRHYGILELEDVASILVDTGGFYPTTIEASGNTLEEKNFNQFFNIMKDQAKIAIEESDLVLLVVDSREGINPFDQSITDYVRRAKKDFWILVNKVDSSKQEGAEIDFYNLGVDEDQLITISAAHGLGFHELRDRLKKTILEKQKNKDFESLQNGVVPASEVVANVSLIGAPNAGKSTLLNRLIGSERALVSDIPGTTVDPIEGYFELYFGDDVKHLKNYQNDFLDQATIQEIEADESEDATEDQEFEATESAEEMDDLEYKIFEAPIDSELETDGEETAETAALAADPQADHIFNEWRTIKIVDTAGIRKQKSVEGFIESQSVIRSLKSITDSDVVIFMVDATIGITHQDRRLCDIALEKGKSLILCLNKIDLVRMNFQDGKKRKEWLQNMRDNIPWLNFCELITISAKNGSHVNYLKTSLVKTITIRHKKLGTGELNRAVTELIDRNPITIKNTRGLRFKVKYASMIKAAPPTILLFSNKSKNIPDNYRKYLTNGLRAKFNLVNTPVHLIFRSGFDLEKRLAGMEKATSSEHN